MEQNNIVTLRHYSPFSWIAIDEGEKVVGEGATLKEAESQAKEHGVEHPGLLKVPPKDAVYVPTSF